VSVDATEALKPERLRL